MKTGRILYILLITILMVAGCGTKQGIRIGLDVKDNKLNNIVSKVPANKDAYIEYTQKSSFNAGTVELEVYSGDRTISGGSNVVKPEDTSVIIPITVPKPGIYRLKVYIRDSVVYQTDLAVQ